MVTQHTAVTPPYPGALFDLSGIRVFIARSYYSNETAISTTPRIYMEQNRLYADCSDGKRFCILELSIDNEIVEPTKFVDRFDNELILDNLSVG